MTWRTPTTALAVLTAISAMLVVGPADALARHHGKGNRGTLTIAVSGLRRGEHPRLNVRGPHGFRRAVRGGRHVTLKHLRAGTYRISAKPAKLGAARGIPAGSRDYPSTADAKARVRAGRRAHVKLRYGNIVS